LSFNFYLFQQQVQRQFNLEEIPEVDKFFETFNKRIKMTEHTKIS